MSRFWEWWSEYWVPVAITLFTVVGVVAIVGACVIAANAPPPSNGTEQVALMVPAEGNAASNFEVVCVTEFADNLAYDGKRGIYIITVKNTGEKFIGVSGIGVAAMGKHSHDETTHVDER